MAITSKTRKLKELGSNALASKSRGFSNIATPTSVIKQRATRNVEEILGATEQARAREAQQEIRAAEFDVEYAETTDDRKGLEKLLNLQQDQGAFGNFFEVLNRPAQFIKGLTLEGGEGAIKGISGQKVYTGQDIMEAVGIINEDSPALLKGIAGFAAEIAVDPLTYGLNPLKWGKSAITAAGGAGVTALTTSANPKVAAMATKIFDSMSDFGNAVKGSFGLFKDEIFKGFKTENLNRQAHTYAAQQEGAELLFAAKKDMTSTVDEMISNPGTKENADIFNELGYSQNAKQENYLARDKIVPKHTAPYETRLELEKRGLTFDTNSINRSPKVSPKSNDYKLFKKIYDDMGLLPDATPNNAKLLREMGFKIDMPTNAELYDVMWSEVGRQVESMTKKTLSKEKVYSKLGEVANPQTGGGSFFIASEGAEANTQASTIIDAIKEDWAARYPGEELTDAQISWNPETNFIDVDADVAKFARQQVKTNVDIRNKHKIFGTENELEASLNEMARTGRVTLDLSDPVDLEMLKVLKKHFPDKVKAKISGGRGTRSFTVTPKEVDKLMKTDDVMSVLKTTKKFTEDTASITAHQRELHKLQQRRMVAEGNFDKSTKPLYNQIDDLGKEAIRNNEEYLSLQKQVIEQKAIVDQGKINWGKRSIDGQYTEKVLPLQKKYTAAKNNLNKLQKKYEGVKKKIATQQRNLDKKLAVIQGREADLTEIVNQMQKKLNRQESTFRKLARNTDMNLGKGSTEADLVNEFVKPPIDKITFGVTDDAFRSEIQNFGSMLERINKYTDGEFFRYNFTESTIMGLSDRFKHHVGVVDQVRQKMLNDGVKIHGKGYQGIIDSLNAEGYMRHIANPDAVVYSKLEALDNAKGTNLAQQNKILAQLDPSKRKMAREWVGSAYDINQTLGIDLFNTNPLTSMAVDLQILPNQLKASNVFSTALESGMIRPISAEELIVKDEILADLIRANPKVNSRILTNQAFKKALPKEFAIMNKATHDELLRSLDFMKRSTSPEEFQKLSQVVQGLTFEDAGGATNIIHKGTMNQIRQYGKKAASGDLKPLTDFADKYLVQPFKATATLSAGFTVRNFFTNGTNAYLAGIPMNTYVRQFPKAVGDIRNIEKLVPKINQALIKAGKRSSTAKNQARIINEALSKSDRVLWKKAQEWYAHGMLGKNTYSKDIDTILGRAARVFDGSDSALVKGAKEVSAQSMRMNKITDQASKITAYEFAKSAKGKAVMSKFGHKTPEEFARFVFFEYNDLSKFESQIMRTLVPFYTWGRKNAEFQIKNMLAQPERYTRLNQAMNEYQGLFFEDPDERSQWDKESMNLPVYRKKDGTVVMMKFTPGFMDLDNMRKQPLNRLNPVIKAPLESMIGQNLFSGAEANSNVFAQFSGTVIGDFGELGKAVANQEFDKQREGLVTRKLREASQVVKAPFQNDEFSPEQVMPSFFRTTDPEANVASNINNRITRSRDYLKILENQGAYRKITPGVVKYRNRKLNNYGGNF